MAAYLLDQVAGEVRGMEWSGNQNLGLRQYTLIFFIVKAGITYINNVLFKSAVLPFLITSDL
jgi:hypothetical protein